MFSTLLRAIFSFGLLYCFCCSFFFTLIPRRGVLNRLDIPAEELARTEKQSAMTQCWLVHCEPVRSSRHLFDRWLHIPYSRVANTLSSRVCIFSWDTSLSVSSRYKRHLSTSTDMIPSEMMVHDGVSYIQCLFCASSLISYCCLVFVSSLPLSLSHPFLSASEFNQLPAIVRFGLD